MVSVFTIHDMVEGKLWCLLLPFMIWLKVSAFTIHDMAEGKLWSLLLPFMI